MSKEMSVRDANTILNGGVDPVVASRVHPAHPLMRRLKDLVETYGDAEFALGEWQKDDEASYAEVHARRNVASDALWSELRSQFAALLSSEGETKHD